MTNINNNKIEIYVKGGFSERKGIKKFSDIVQVKDLNKRTRNKLYNEIHDLLMDGDNNFKGQLVKYIYTEIFSMSNDDVPIDDFGFLGNWEEILDDIKEICINREYNEVFDFIEGIIKGIDFCEFYSYNKQCFVESINNVFVQENVNYRIIDNHIIDVVDEQEINSIEETLNSPFEIVKKHYNKAIKKLYKDKDYENSIKESITSVEAMCQIINGSKETLGKALNNLKIQIHPALKSAYSSIYGYTSDENGTRHANGIGEKNATFSEAKYMLVSCSAFINYLRENYEENQNG